MTLAFRLVITRWWHVDPVTGSLRETDIGGNLAVRSEFDPLGNDAPLVDPAPPDNPSPDYLYTGTYGNSGNTCDGASGCTVDGQPMDCSFAARLVSNGQAGACPDNRCSKPTERGLEFFRAFADGYEGYLTTSQEYLGDGVVFDQRTNDELAGLGRMWRGVTPFVAGQKRSLVLQCQSVRLTLT